MCIRDRKSLDFDPSGALLGWSKVAPALLDAPGFCCAVAHVYADDSPAIMGNGNSRREAEVNWIPFKLVSEEGSTALVGVAVSYTHLDVYKRQIL